MARAQVGLDEEEGKELDTKVQVKASSVKVCMIKVEEWSPKMDEAPQKTLEQELEIKVVEL